MAAKKDKPDKLIKLTDKKVTDQEALKMVVIEKCIRKLYLNGYNYSQTAREMGIGYKQLRKYAMEYGQKFLGDAWNPGEKGTPGKQSRSDAILMESTVPLQVREAEEALLDRNAKLLDAATQAQLMAINRIKVLLTESSMYDSIEALRLLTEIVREPQQQVEKKGNSFLQFIQNQIIQNTTTNPHEE